MRTRVIPVLLLKSRGLYKTVKFKEPRYIGDPINSVRIFNEKEVDELAFIDITATTSGAGPDFELINQIAGEAFMPMAYGGGITKFEQVEQILGCGFEKVIINAAAFDTPALITRVADIYGSQAVVVCLDVRRNWLGRTELSSHSGAKARSVSVVEHVKEMQRLGAGEILVYSIDRDGTMNGYDIEVVKSVTAACSLPVIACGGAGKIEHFQEVVMKGGASAVAAGSMFVYKGVHRAVLINYPDRHVLESTLP